MSLFLDTRYRYLRIYDVSALNMLYDGDSSNTNGNVHRAYARVGATPTTASNDYHGLSQNEMWGGSLPTVTLVRTSSGCPASFGTNNELYDVAYTAYGNQ